MNDSDRGVKSNGLPDAREQAELRVLYYNAELVERIDAHEDLARFRVRPDEGTPRFAPGQYVALGLGYWEPRLPGAQPESLPAKKYWRLVRRAYSISCPMIDEQDRLLTCDDCGYLEFYIALIRSADTAPALTPRLFHLQPGARLFVQSRIVGTYTLEGISPHDTVLFIGTGTGEAPHNAMVARLLSTGHRGPVIVATCVRRASDLAYTRAHDVLMGRYANYRYLPYTTREPRNLDPTRRDFVGVERLQTVYRSGRLAAEAGVELSPKDTHVFLCGNPAMIGLERPGEPPSGAAGMLQLLLADGFRDEGPAGPALVRYEKYW